jgi:lysophospholipase
MSRPVLPKLVASPDNPCPEGVVVGGIETEDGASLRVARWNAVLNARGTVCVFTGRSEYIEKYLETVKGLRERGFAVAAMDWRGQGHSSRQLDDPRKGHVRCFTEFEHDVEVFMRDVVLPHCPPPYYALANSMGATVMLRIAHTGKCRFDRLILVAPMIDLPRGRTAWPLRALMRVLRLAGLGSRYVPGSNVDAVRAKGFVGNPLTTDERRFARNAAIVGGQPSLGIGSPSVAWLDAAFTAMMAFRGADYPSRILQPVLMVAAGDDTIVSPVASAAFAARLPAGSHLVVEGARHELLQEQDDYRAKFWTAFDDFMTGAGTVK